MGVQGAALATIISMSFLSLWVLIHFRSKRCVVPLKRRYIRLQPKMILAILSIGISPFFMQLANSAVQAIFNQIGRASCRERVEISVVGVSVERKSRNV